MDRSPTYYQHFPPSVERESRRNPFSSTSRLSRIPVNTRDNQRRSRMSRSSSAAKRCPATSHLLVPQNRPNIRSKSCVNLEALYSTPLTSSSRSSSRTPVSGSKYSSMNTDFLNSQYSRVKRYFKEKDPSILALKPLTTSVYVQTMNLLFKEIDPRIKINAKQVDAVAEYLKLFKFPSQIKMSALKTPSAPHNFQYVLSIWVWLLDKIEAIHSLMSKLEPDSHNISFNFFVGYFNHMNDTDKLNQLTEEFKQKCKEDLFKKNNIPIVCIDEYKKEHIKLQQEVKEAEEKGLALKKRVNEKRAKDDELNLRKTIAINEKIQREKEIEELQNKLVKLLEDEKQLQDTVNNQSCSLVEWKKILEEDKLLTQKLELKTKQENENKERSEQIDMELMDVKSKIINRIETINYAIIRQLHNFPELEEFLIPQKSLFQANMKQILIDLKKELEHLEKHQSREQIRMKELIGKLNDDKIQLEDNIEHLQKEQSKLVRTIEELEGNKNEITNKKFKLVKELKKRREDKEENHVDHQNKVVNIKKIIAKLRENNEKLLKEKDELNNQQQQDMELGSIFLERVLEETAEAALKSATIVTAAREKVHNILENMSKNLDETIIFFENSENENSYLG